MKPQNKMRPIHPGELLREDFLVPLQMTPHALAIALRVPASRINDITLERVGWARFISSTIPINSIHSN